jgi:hypothetical protein
MKYNKMAEEKKSNTKCSKHCLQYNNVDLNPDAFPAPIFEKKLFPGQMDPETGRVEEIFPVYTAPLIHNTKDAKGKYRQDKFFEVEGPLLTSETGIEISYNQNRNKYQATCQVQHDLSNEDISNFCGIPMENKDFDDLSEEGKSKVGFMSQLYYRCLYYAYRERNKLGIRANNINSFEACFPPLIKWDYNSNGEPLEGRNPYKRYRVLLKGDLRYNHTKAVFSIPAKKDKNNKRGEIVLPWRKMQDVQLIFRPLLRFIDINCGAGRITINCQIVSAVVYGFTKVTLFCRQEATLALAREDEDLLEQLLEQYEDSLEDEEDNTITVRGRGEVTVATPIVSHQIKLPTLIVKKRVCKVESEDELE